MNIRYRPMLAAIAAAVFTTVPVIAQPNTSTREKIAEALKPMHDANVKSMAEYTCNIALIQMDRQNIIDSMNGMAIPTARYDAIITRANECIANPGPSSLFYTYRANAYAKKGDTRSAFADFEKALAAVRTEQKAIVGQDAILEDRADVYIRLGDRAKAEADLREAVRLNPSGSTAKEKLDNLDKKIAEERKKAILANPRTAEDFIVVGNENWNRGKIAEAVAAFDRSIALAPSAAAHIGKGKALSDQKSFDAALAELNKALTLAPKNNDALFWRGRIQHDLKRWDAAIADFTAVLATADAKEKPNFLNWRGRAYAGKAAYALALKDHEAALAAAGNDSFARIDAFTGKGVALKGQGKNAEAIAAFDAAVAAAGNDYFARFNLVDTWFARGELYASQGKKDLARADFNEILKMVPDSKEAKLELAKLNGTAAAQPAPDWTAEQWAAEGRQQAGAKNYEGAIKSFSECLRLQPAAFACHALRGSVYGMKGDMAASKADFDKAFQMGKTMQAPIHFMRAMMFIELGKKDEAIADLRAGLQIDPNNAQAKATLQRLGVQP